MELKSLIQAYIRLWASYIRDLEEYKWIAFKQFNKFFYDTDIPYIARVDYSFKMSANLLVSRNYFPYGMLKELSKGSPKIMEDLLINGLFNESLPLKDRIKEYIDGAKNVMLQMAKSGHSDWKGRTNLQTYQDAHAISVYLAMRFPTKYYIYKSSVFIDFANYVGYTIESKNHIDKCLEYFKLCDRVKQDLLQEGTFLSVYNQWLKNNEYEDPNYCLLTQDFIYAVARHLSVKKDDGKKTIKENVITSDIKKYKEVIKKIDKTHIWKNKNYEEIDRQRAGLGHEGELWVVRYEMDRLKQLGVSIEVEHTSVVVGDGTGYDILSVEDDGKTKRYIEVKTTTGSCKQPLYYSVNELEFSRKNRDNYYLYRVFDFKSTMDAARLAIFKGGLDELEGTPVSFKASVEK